MTELSRRAFQAVITDRGCGAITTQIAPASDFECYIAEHHHQQYLYTVPNGGRWREDVMQALLYAAWLAEECEVTPASA